MPRARSAVNDPRRDAPPHRRPPNHRLEPAHFPGGSGLLSAAHRSRRPSWWPAPAPRRTAILRGEDDRLLAVVGPCSIHDPGGGAGIRRQAETGGRTPEGRCVRHHARLFRKTPHHGGLERPDQRPESGRLLRHQPRPARRPRLVAGSGQHGRAGRHRVSGHDFAAIHRGSDRLGCDRRAHHRVADPPGTGVRALDARGFQKRHRRLDPDRARRDPIGLASASFPVGDQTRGFGDFFHRRQRILPPDPARRQNRPELRKSLHRRGCGHAARAAPAPNR